MGIDRPFSRARARRRWLPFIAAQTLIVSLGGCAAVSGFPKPAFDQSQEDAELAPYLGQGKLEAIESCANKLLCRNQVIDARLRAVDLAFYRFQRKLYAQEGRVSLGSDLLSFGFSSIASLTATKGLAAGAALVNGGRDAYKKQVLSISLPLLFSQMTARRRMILLRIRQGEALPLDAYPIFQALDDISDYELAGSLPAAAAELNAAAGNQAQVAQAQLDALRAANMAAALAANASGQPAMAQAMTVTSSPVATSTITTTGPVTGGTLVTSPVTGAAVIPTHGTAGSRVVPAATGGATIVTSSPVVATPTGQTSGAVSPARPAGGVTTVAPPSVQTL